MTKANRPVKLTIIRDGKTIEREVVPAAVGKYEEGVTGVMPPLRPQIASVQPGEPAEEAGLRGGDVILAVNGEKPIVHARVIEIIRANEGKPLQFEILRDGSTLTIPVTPAEVRRHRADRRADPRARSAHHPAEPSRSVQAERAAELRLGEADRAHARRPVHARHVGQAADGPGRDRRAVG